MSETYRQTSVASPELVAADPYNRECARQSPFRHEAEIIRDHALAVSGLLVMKIGGPSVKPYQPEGYWENLNFPARTYQNDSGDSQYRRGLYTWWQRSFLHPSMVAFDAPSREECTAERNRSNIPQQALVLLNDPTYVESARAFAARILTECQGDRRPAFVGLAGRPPARSRCGGGQARRRSRHQTPRRIPGRSRRRGRVAEGRVGAATEKVDPAELAAWTHVARVLLNLHEASPGVKWRMNAMTSDRDFYDIRDSSFGIRHSFPRRAFLGRSAQGLGSVALASLLSPASPAPRPGPRPTAPAAARQARHLADDGRRPFAARALRSQAEARGDGWQTDAGFLHQGSTARPAPGTTVGLSGSPFKFQRFGKNGTELSELLPHLGRSPMKSVS